VFKNTNECNFPPDTGFEEGKRWIKGQDRKKLSGGKRRKRERREGGRGLF